MTTKKQQHRSRPPATNVARHHVSTDPKERQAHFTKIPDSVGEAAWMNGSLLYVYYAVAKHRNFAAPDEPVFPSQARIARITKLKERQVRRLLKVLEEHGVFRRAPGGRGHSTRYTFQQDDRSWVSGQKGTPAGEPRARAVMDDRSKEVMGDRSKAVMGDPLSRASENRASNERSSAKSAKCFHPDTACCSNCLTPTAVSRASSPSSPKSESQDDDF